MTEEQLLDARRQELTAARELAVNSQQQQLQDGSMNEMFMGMFIKLTRMIDPELAESLGLNEMFAQVMGFEDGEEYQKYWEENLSPQAPEGAWKDNPPPNMDFNQARRVVLSENFQPGDNALLDVIAQHESGGDYNIAYGGRQADFTNMTIDEVMEWQDDYVNAGSPSSAAGRYQIINKTLGGLKEDMGLSGDEMFDEAMQDKMAMVLLERRGYSQYQDAKEQYEAGEMSEEQFTRIEDRFMESISKEWASMPKDESGRSYYAGDGLNKALTTPDAMRMAMRESGPLEVRPDDPENTNAPTQVASAENAKVNLDHETPGRPATEGTELGLSSAASDLGNPVATAAEDIPENIRHPDLQPEPVSDGPRTSFASLIDPMGSMKAFSLTEKFDNVRDPALSPNAPEPGQPAPAQQQELAMQQQQQQEQQLAMQQQQQPRGPGMGGVS